MLSRLLGGMAITAAAASFAWAQTAPPAPLPQTKVTAAAPALKATTEPAKAADAAAAPLATPASNLLAQGCAQPCPTCCCIPCGPPGKYWIDAGYIFWTTSGQHVPPLVTSAPVGTPRDLAGALGQPGIATCFSPPATSIATGAAASI